MNNKIKGEAPKEEILSPEELFEEIYNKISNNMYKSDGSIFIVKEQFISLIQERDKLIKIAENESILNLAETHGENDRVKFVLKMRISDLKNYPNFLNAPDAI